MRFTLAAGLAIASLSLIAGCDGDENDGAATKPSRVDATGQELERAADFADRVTLRSDDVPVAVLFTAKWSGPDRVLRPILDRVIASRTGEVELVVVDVDELPAVANRYEVLSVPTVAAFVDGELEGRIVGALPEDRLARQLDDAIASRSRSP